jgi:hypothetical protein
LLHCIGLINLHGVLGSCISPCISCCGLLLFLHLLLLPGGLLLLLVLMLQLITSRLRHH